VLLPRRCLIFATRVCFYDKAPYNVVHAIRPFAMLG
jgi:hypothetical protein